VLNRIFLLLFIPLYLFGRVIYEEPPFFIPAYPTIFEVSLTDGENPQNAYLLYKSSDMNIYKKIKMECNEVSCKAIMPRQKPYSKIEYKLVIKFCSGKKLETGTLVLDSIPLPEWQKDTQLKNSFINIYSRDRELKGFIPEKVIFKEFPQKDRFTKIEENSSSEEESDSWWDSLKFWEMQENGEDENSEIKCDSSLESENDSFEGGYREIFTP